MPQEAHLRCRLQEPRDRFAGTIAQRRLTKRSREKLQCEVPRTLLPRAWVNRGKKEGRSCALRPDPSFAAPTRLLCFVTETGAKPTPTQPRVPRRRSTRSARSG